MISAQAATPAKKAASAAPVPTASPEQAFKQSIVSYLTANGASPLSKVGSACKRPAGVKSKLKGFIKEHPTVFSLDNDNVNLV